MSKLAKRLQARDKPLTEDEIERLVGPLDPAFEDILWWIPGVPEPIEPFDAMPVRKRGTGSRHG